MKIGVFGDIGKGATIALLNLDDITEVELPNGQIAYLLWSNFTFYRIFINLRIINFYFFLLLYSFSNNIHFIC